MSVLWELLGRKRRNRDVEAAEDVLQGRNAESSKILKVKVGSDYGLKVLYQPLDESKAVVE